MELLIPAAIGLAAGLVGGLLGVGGSVIVIPGLVLYLSQMGRYDGSAQHLIQAAAMICNVFVAAPSVLAHRRARAITKSVVVFLVPAAVAGILLGVGVSNTALFARHRGVYLAMVFACFMAYVAVYNAWRLRAKTDLEQGFDRRPKPPAAAVAGVGLVMGFAAGLLGIGGGALCVPMQQVFLRIPLRRAIANSAATILCVSPIGALFKNATLGHHGIEVTRSLELALLLVPTAILGSYVGGWLTHALPRRALRVVFIVFMVTMAYLTFARAWQARSPREETSPPASSAIESQAGRVAGAAVDRAKPQAATPLSAPDS
jgi:uncharacterized membrane protein YfcA